MTQVKAIPRGVDFSRIAKDSYASRKARTASSSKPEADASKKQDDPVCQASAKPTSDAKREASDYSGWKNARLKEECKKLGMPITGNKADLIARLNGPRPPTIWVQRKNAELYVPNRYDSCGCAILVAIYLHQRQQPDQKEWKGLEKDEIVTLAESLDISRDPFTGTGKGMFHYDGWSCMGALREGQSPLVWRQKGGYFKLTTIGEFSGFRIAEAMHDWCHQHGKCRCDQAGLSL